MANTPQATPRDYLDMEHDFNVTISTIQGVMDLRSSVEPNNVPPAENLAKLGNGMRKTRTLLDPFRDTGRPAIRRASDRGKGQKEGHMTSKAGEARSVFSTHGRASNHDHLCGGNHG